jgi:protein-S-isoprenylcysteine O-methyltransferase Ste14
MNEIRHFLEERERFDLFGLRQVTRYLRRTPCTEPGFEVVFFSQYVRHPIHLGWPPIFWAAPRMRLGHLLFAAVMSSYIFLAVRYEEHDLVSSTWLPSPLHGSDYVQYRRRVPMLIPRIGGRRLVRHE